MTENPFAAFQATDRRLVELRCLACANGYTVNEVLLSMALDQRGHQVSRDQVRTDLAWLAEQGLVTVRELGGIHLGTLTGRGLDVAEGRAVVPGVRRPGPED